MFPTKNNVTYCDLHSILIKRFPVFMVKKIRKKINVSDGKKKIARCCAEEKSTLEGN